MHNRFDDPSKQQGVSGMKIMLAILFTLVSCTAAAEVFKWTDKHGVVHYEDKPPENKDKISAAKVEKLELSPIQILDDGSVRNTGKENAGLLAKWLDKAEDLKVDILRRIETWRGKTPVVSQQTNVVEIYTASWCSACKKAKRWLGEHGVAYKDYDIEKDANAALRMRKLGGGGSVPFAVINGETFQGFDPAGYQAALR
jgi:mycoredoxin